MAFAKQAVGLLWLSLPLVAEAQVVINTIAGGYIPNNVPALSASIGYPAEIAIGPSSGNVYVAGMYSVYKLDSSGRLTLYAGTGSLGKIVESGPATQSPLTQVLDLAVDANENLYILDLLPALPFSACFLAVRILRVDPATALMSTVSSGCQFAPTAIDEPSEDLLATNSRGHLLLTTPMGEVDEYDPIGNAVQKVAGSGTSGFYQGEGGPATEARLGGLLMVRADAANNVFILDPGNERIYRVDSTSGAILTRAGTGATPSRTCTADGTPGNMIAIQQTFYFAVTATGDVLFNDVACASVLSAK